MHCEVLASVYDYLRSLIIMSFENLNSAKRRVGFIGMTQVATAKKLVRSLSTMHHFIQPC